MILSAAYWNAYDHEDCERYEGGMNPIYWNPAYYFKYAADWNAYSNGIILGDSTMDLAVNAYTGYITRAGIGAYPVSGNKSCDINMQLANVHAQPAFVWLSTAGGNDLLGGVSDSDSAKSINAMLDRVRVKFPQAKLCVILVHPTLVTYGNQHKAAVNALTAAHVSAMGNAVSYNPLPIFGVAEGQAAPASMLIDTIHPNQAATLLIRNAAQTACSVTL